MRLKTKLFDGPVSNAQAAVIMLWVIVLAGIVLLWSSTSLSLLTSSTAGGFTAVGRAFGLLAVFFALTQFMLMGRVAWIEKSFGLEKLASYHRINGYLAITCIIIHPILIITGYSIASHTNYIRQYLQVVEHYPHVYLALIGQILFITVVATTIYIVRKRLKFENWYYVHLMVYAAIVLAFFHQVANGGSFQGGPTARYAWYALYAFVALNVLVWRFGAPVVNLLRFNWKVSKVVTETATTTSVYISGRGLGRWKAQAGQFVLVRIFAPGLWWQEHPFSISHLPDEQGFRITVRDVGDYTKAIQRLKPGAKLLVSGPYGRFTRNVAQTNKRLFISGGVGITPIRTLAEEAAAARVDSVLLYGNRNPMDTVLKTELDSLGDLKVFYIYSEAPAKYRGETGRIDLTTIKRLVPDYKQRDIYLCGPQPMMAAIVESLEMAGFPGKQLHYERFALHN